MRLSRFLPVLVLVALVGAACGSDDPSIDAGASAAEHNEADVDFAQGMVPHHEQAVEMSDLAAAKAVDPKVKDLAARIKQAQGPEIITMKGWLEDWGEEVPDEGGHGGMEMSGMMSADDMEKLERASGTNFDRVFLEMMIRHHEGAISMANIEAAKGAFPPAKDLAARIIGSQQTEIDEMKRLLGTPNP